MEMVTNIFNLLISNIKFVLIAVSIIFCLLFLNQCKKAKDLDNQIKVEKELNEQNIKALNDSIRKSIDEQNNQVFKKLSYVVNDMERLKLLDKNLYDKLFDEKGRPRVYLETKVVYREKHIYMPTLVEHNGDSTNLKWSHYNKDDGSYQILEGYTSVKIDSVYKDKLKVGNTHITKNEIGIDLDVILKDNENGDSTEFVIKSKSPNISIEKINGVTLIEKNKPSRYKDRRSFSIGPQIGVTHSFEHKRPMPYIGIGLQYNLINFGPRILNKKRKNKFN